MMASKDKRSDGSDQGAEQGATDSASQATEVARGRWFTIRSIEPTGFYRGGRAWTPTPQLVNEDEFTPEQWAEIEVEPLIAVVPHEPPSAILSASNQ
jgi:hypothetical protein